MSEAIDRLEIQVQTQAQKANSELDKMASKLERISGSLSRINVSGLQGLANGVDRLSTSMQNISAVKTTDFTRLAKNIEKLGNINQAGINNTANALRQISSALTASNVSGEALKGLSDLANGISRLGYKSVGNAITNLPLLAKAMREFMSTLSTAPQVSANLIQMTNAMANLASQGSKYGSTINSISRATNTLTKSQNTAYKSNINFIASLSKLTVAYYILRRAIRAAWQPIQQSMDYGETINLFQVTFKKIGMDAAVDSGMTWGSEAANAYAKTFIEKAQSFNDKIVDALSLDPDTIMKYQAMFGSMANSIGLTSNSVKNLSDSFTMLGVDLASLFNLDIEEAMTKLKSGIAGETEPLRALGIDITEATLKQVALAHGIDKSVASMSYAEKTQLRYLAIMEQTQTAWGDMAKTIDSPANQLRVLSQQWTNLSRSIGNVFLPVVTTVLPYINGLVIALRQMMDTIATAVGYELPNYSDYTPYADMASGVDEYTDSVDDATKANDKLKKSIASFDELNILTENKSKTATDTSGSGSPILDNAINQTTNSYMKKFNEELEKSSNNAKKIAKKIKDFFDDIAEKAAPAAKALKDLSEKLEPFTKNIGEGWDWLYKNLIAPLAETTISETVPNALYALSSAIGAINTAVDKFQRLKSEDSIFGFLAKLQNSKVKEISNWFKKIGDAFTALDKFIQNPNWKDLWEYIKNALSISFDISGVPDFTDLATLFGLPKELKIPIKAFIATTWEMLKEKWESITKHIIPIVAYFSAQVATKWNDIKARYEELIKNFVGKTIKFLVTIPQVWKDLRQRYLDMHEKFIGKTVKFLVSVPQAWKDISTKFHNLYDNFIGKTVEFAVKLVTTLGDIRNFVNSIISAVNENIIAKLKIDIPLLGLHVSAPQIPLIQTRASGGYVNDGQMFVVRENGIPEMVGRIGNRTAVANNDQITQSIAVAVENSMMNVLAPFFAKLTGNNNSGDISINIDGKEVFRAVRNQSKQYYNMTGKSPFPA
jgi:hypothetical protein